MLTFKSCCGSLTRLLIRMLLLISILSVGVVILFEWHLRTLLEQQQHATNHISSNQNGDGYHGLSTNLADLPKSIKTRTKKKTARTLYWQGKDYIDQGNGQSRPVIPSDLRLGNLSVCQSDYGGPAPEAAQEMVYWQEIPTDHAYRSPYLGHRTINNYQQQQRYLTFEPDGGGFNNIRMAMETVLAIAHAMGRTLVLPPTQDVYLLSDSNAGTQRREFGFADFFPMRQIASEQAGLQIISNEEFLLREGVTGHLHNQQDGSVSFPPYNRTNWEGMTDSVALEFQPWLESVAFMPSTLNPANCLLAFPLINGTVLPGGSYDYRDPESGDLRLQRLWYDVIRKRGAFPPPEFYVGRPVPVYAPALDRLLENHGGRQGLCFYNSTMQQAPVLHFHGKKRLAGRLLVHFYAFLFFEDWKVDLWTKRFIRDHVRYVDEIQCAAARVVHAIRQHVRERDPTNVEGAFDAFHVRRGEFQYKQTRLSAKEIYDASKDEIPNGRTVFIATDEREKSFFQDLADHFDLVYLDDYAYLLEGINTNKYGMIDQLVASRSKTFFGCYFSTFSGYINRLRGYHADRLKLPGFENGKIQSYYYALPQSKNRMREYWPVSGAIYAREFPVSWRNIDQGIDMLLID